MNNDDYAPLFNAFEPAATAKLTEISDILKTQYGRETSEIEVIDHDVDRGVGFSVDGSPELCVELMLNDGEESGFDGVGLTMRCSTRGTGQIWAPYNYTEDVGTRDTEVILERLSSMDVQAVALAIQDEWIGCEIEADNQSKTTKSAKP